MCLLVSHFWISRSAYCLAFYYPHWTMFEFNFLTFFSFSYTVFCPFMAVCMHGKEKWRQHHKYGYVSNNSHAVSKIFVPLERRVAYMIMTQNLNLITQNTVRLRRHEMKQISISVILQNFLYRLKPSDINYCCNHSSSLYIDFKRLYQFIWYTFHIFVNI